MAFQNIGIVGSGTMGHGIAHVCALAGQDVHLYDVDAGRVDAALAKVRGNLDKGVEKGKLSPLERDAALTHLHGATTLDALAGSDLVIEAIPERLDLKRALFQELEARVSSRAVLATNTSSLSIGSIAAELSHPGRVLGTHFFNPVHIMTLLEIVVYDGTDTAVLDAVRAWGETIGKECITVRDAPGFATSRLGVCLGMEAIRMVEQGVASPEDIDKAMVLGYRHPVGPLRLTDMVGLDVRMNIGEHLATALGNPAFQPPALMRRMVADGKLGQKSGEGFYRWGTPQE